MGFFDALGGLDDRRRNAYDDFGDSFANNPDPETQSLKKTSGKFSDWYSGPGGESATKIGLAALLAIAGGQIAGGFGAGGESAGGGGSTGGMGSMFGKQGIGMLGNLLGGMGGGDQGGTQQKRRGILAMGGGATPQASTPLFSLGDNDMIDPSTYDWLRRASGA